MPPDKTQPSTGFEPGVSLASYKRHVTPKIKSTLGILEPTKLPIANPEEPSNIALSDTTSSGAGVPMATTVIPITSGDIP